FGAAYGVRTGIHVGVDVLVNKLKSPWRNAVVMFGLFGGAFFTFVIGTMGAKFVYGLSGTDQVTPDMELPSWIVYLCIPRLLPDVLPLPSGRLVVLAYR